MIHIADSLHRTLKLANGPHKETETTDEFKRFIKKLKRGRRWSKSQIVRRSEMRKGYYINMFNICGLSIICPLSIFFYFLIQHIPLQFPLPLKPMIINFVQYFAIITFVLTAIGLLQCIWLKKDGTKLLNLFEKYEIDEIDLSKY